MRAVAHFCQERFVALLQLNRLLLESSVLSVQGIVPIQGAEDRLEHVRETRKAHKLLHHGGG